MAFSSMSFDSEPSTADEMRPEYDFGNLQVLRKGSGRIGTRLTVVLDADVSDHFSSSEAVNSALRNLIESHSD
jgi:hypothetical protein